MFYGLDIDCSKDFLPLVWVEIPIRVVGNYFLVSFLFCISLEVHQWYSNCQENFLIPLIQYYSLSNFLQQYLSDRGDSENKTIITQIIVAILLVVFIFIDHCCVAKGNN